MAAAPKKITEYEQELSPEEYKRLDDWCTRVFHQLHWEELAPVSDSITTFKRYVMRDRKTDAELREIELAIDSQCKTFRQQARKGKVVGIKCLSSWYNAEMWLDVVTHDNLERPKNKQVEVCAKDGCNNAVHGPSWNYCGYHMRDPMKDKRAQAAIKAGLMPKEGETRQEWLARCRQSARAGFKGVLKKPDYL